MARVGKWEWTDSAGYSSCRRLLIKRRELSSKFFTSNNHARQIEALSPDCAPPLMTLIQRDVLFAAISPPLCVLVNERRKACWSRGLGHTSFSKMALCVIRGGSFDKRSKVGMVQREDFCKPTHPPTQNYPSVSQGSWAYFRRQEFPRPAPVGREGSVQCLFPAAPSSLGMKLDCSPSASPAVPGSPKPTLGQASVLLRGYLFFNH